MTIDLDLKQQAIEKLEKLYGSNTIKYLDTIGNVGFSSYIHLSAYDPQKECTEIFAAGASALVMTGLFPTFISNLKSHLSELAKERTEVYYGKDVPNLQDLFKAQAREIVEKINILTAKRPLSKEEEKKIAESLVYAIAALQDPLNPRLINKLIKNATQTVGESSGFKNVLGALSLFAFTAIVIFSFVAIPWTGGLSLPLGLAVGGSLLSAGSAAGFFYTGREKSVAKEMRKLGESLQNYQEDHKKNPPPVH